MVEGGLPFVKRRRALKCGAVILERSGGIGFCYSILKGGVGRLAVINGHCSPR